MKDSPLIFLVGFNPKEANRERRRLIDKELRFSAKLRGILTLFKKAITEEPENHDYEDAFRIFNQAWIQECEVINELRVPKTYIANNTYFKDNFGVDGDKQKEYKNSISIIKTIQRIWK